MELCYITLAKSCIIHTFILLLNRLTVELFNRLVV